MLHPPTPPIAPPPPIAIIATADIPVEQRRPPARSQVFHGNPQIAYMPACTQLVSQTAPDGVIWGVVMPDGTVNPLAVSEPLEVARAHAALSAMGVCKAQGVDVPITALRDEQLRHTVLQVGVDVAPAKKTTGDLARIVVGGGLIALAGGLFILSQRSHNQASDSRDRLKALLEGGNND